MVNAKLQRARKARHWSLDEASSRIGVSRLTYIRWEQGRQVPHDSSLRMACEAFCLSAEQLGFGGPVMEYLTSSPQELLQRYDEAMIRVEALGWVLPQVLLFDNSVWRLPADAIQLQVDATPYTVPAEIEALSSGIVSKLKSHFFDSTTLRLKHVSLDQRGLTLTVQKAYYYDYLATNYVMDVLRDVVHPERKLEPLETSRLVNHLGVNALVFTSDHALILPVRAEERVGIWQGRLMPSISGATSFDDESLIAAWMREGRDELRLERSDFGKITFLGMTRELLRGGKPEAFFAVQLTLSRRVVAQRFTSARDQWENNELQWVEDIPALLHDFERMSQPLQASLALWYKYGEEEKEYETAS